MTEQPFDTLHLDLDDDGILTVTLNRPDALNAFDLQMASDLLNLFIRVRVDDAVRAVVVTGAGRAFCAGMDLSAEGNVFGLDESLDPTPARVREALGAISPYDSPMAEAYEEGFRDTGGKVTLAIRECRKPVIAAINGAAVGIGATMTLAMDVRLASDAARIGFVFGRLGIVPEATSSFYLPRIVGLQTALEWVYSARILTAQEALDGRLLRSVHAPDDLLPAAHALAREFTKDRSPVAVAMARELLYAGAGDDDPTQTHRRDSLAMWHASVGDGKEGVAAFLEKRTPQFTGRASEMPRLD